MRTSLEWLWGVLSGGGVDARGAAGALARRGVAGGGVEGVEGVGLRSINNGVDGTNYGMFEMGQPLHAFDYDRLGGRRIVVREARPGEKLVSIDGHERVLEPGMLLIADAQRPVALAGVMGG